jgi:nucleoside-diphosphate-sugar epimerase
MRVLIIGGGGVIGQKLARKLAERGHLRGADIAHLTLADVINPAPIMAGFPVDVELVDISDRASVDQLILGRYDVIYLLAAIVSAQAEEDFDAGMNINLFGTYHVFEAVRALATKPCDRVFILCRCLWRRSA